MSILFRSTLRATASSSRITIPTLAPMAIRYNSTTSSSQEPKTPPTSGEIFALPSSSSSSSSSSSNNTPSSNVKPSSSHETSAFAKLRFHPLTSPNQKDTQSDPETWWRYLSNKSIQGVPTNTSTGRTIVVPKGGEFTSSYKRLQGLLRQSNMKKEMRLNEFHEKGSVKRRRLISERHRRRFKEMVRAKVQQVVSMRNRS